MKKFIEAGTADYKLAGLQIDLLQKIRNKKISLEEFEKYLSLKPAQRQKMFGAEINTVVDKNKLVRQKAAELGFLVDGPYEVNIEDLAQGDGEFDVITEYAGDILGRLKQAGDNRSIGKKIFWLVNLQTSKSSEKAINGIEALGLNSPEMLYGLDFAKAFPDIQRKKFWIAMGKRNISVRDGGGDRPVLVFSGGVGTRRKLDADSLDGGWSGRCWFLAGE